MSDEQFEELLEPVLESPNVQKMASYRQHGTETTLEHTVSVARLAMRMADALHMRVDKRSLVRGGVLHDYFLYNWHDRAEIPGLWHGYIHPKQALINAERDFDDLNDIERDIIVHHMFPLNPRPPRSREAWLVSAADKIRAVEEFFNGYVLKSNKRKAA